MGTLSRLENLMRALGSLSRKMHEMRVLLTHSWGAGTPGHTPTHSQQIVSDLSGEESLLPSPRSDPEGWRCETPSYSSHQRQRSTLYSGKSSESGGGSPLQTPCSVLGSHFQGRVLKPPVAPPLQTLKSVQTGLSGGKAWRRFRQQLKRPSITF